MGGRRSNRGPGTPDGGDADGDGDSDNLDLFQMRSTYGMPSSDPAHKWFFDYDYDNDGDVDNTDLFQARDRRGITYAE